MTALISDDGLYRYSLTRTFSNLFESEIRKVVFVMLNPSTADASNDDPTLRRCISFAKREGFNKLEVVNLYAFRSTNPDALWEQNDPIGQENDRVISEAIQDAGLVICAWGANARQSRVDEVIKILKDKDIKICCLGRTKSGFPRHPLYVPNDQPLEEYL